MVRADIAGSDTLNPGTSTLVRPLEPAKYMVGLEEACLVVGEETTPDMLASKLRVLGELKVCPPLIHPAVSYVRRRLTRLVQTCWASEADVVESHSMTQLTCIHTSPLPLQVEKVRLRNLVGSFRYDGYPPNTPLDVSLASHATELSLSGKLGPGGVVLPDSIEHLTLGNPGLDWVDDMEWLLKPKGALPLTPSPPSIVCRPVPLHPHP